MSALPEPIRPSMSDPRHFVRVRVEDLVIDSAVQRMIDTKRVEQIRNDFRWDLFEAPTCSSRDGVLRVIEGQHRTLALRDIDLDCEITVIVLPDELADQREAEVQLEMLAGRKGHSPVDQYKLEIRAEHPIALAIEATVTAAGLSIQHHGNHNAIKAIGAVKDVFNLGPTPVDVDHGREALGMTLDVIRAAYPDNDAASRKDRWKGDIIRAVGFLISKARQRGENLDLDVLARAIRHRVAQQWIEMARDERGRKSMTMIIEEQFKKQYAQELRDHLRSER